MKGASAEITLHCTGAGRCTGLLALVDRVTEKRFITRNGRRVPVTHLRKILFGTAGFSLDAGASQILSVHLTGLGQTLFRRVGKKGLEVKLTGSGVKSGALVLKKAPARGAAADR